MTSGLHLGWIEDALRKRCAAVEAELQAAQEREAEALRYLNSYCDSGDPDPREDDGEEMTNQDAYVLSAILTLATQRTEEPSE